MSDDQWPSRQCNNCNRRVTVEFLADVAFCSECNSLILPGGDSLPSLSPDRTYINLLLGVDSFQIQITAQGDRAPTAAKSVLEALETFEVVYSSEVCAVCIDSMVIGEICKKLPCGHCYHENCILTWLRKRNSCSVCRFQL